MAEPLKNSEISQNNQTKSSFEIRDDVHSGVWYTNRNNELETQINCWLEMSKCEIKNIKTLKALIVPHSGFAYSGLTASWAYKYFKPNENMKIFIFGPCHYLYLRSCGLSSMKEYKTPLGNIEIDLETIKDLHEEGNFESVDKDAEEEEHSIEMQLPFIKKLMAGLPFKIIPVYIGSLEPKLHKSYGEIFRKYVQDKNCFFIISTDLTHWGTKWNFTYHNTEDGEIFECIEKIDRKFMEIVETQNNMLIQKFLDETEVHICGKHAILIYFSALMNMIKTSGTYTKFVKYSQTFPIKDKKDSSISFGSAIIYTQD